MGDRCIICYRPLNADSVPCPSCPCGRRVCPHHASRPAGEPTATQLYNAVKALRAVNGHRVLTIPEINSVLVARDEWTAGVATGPQATPDQDDTDDFLAERPSGVQENNR